MSATTWTLVLVCGVLVGRTVAGVPFSTPKIDRPAASVTTKFFAGEPSPPFSPNFRGSKTEGIGPVQDAMMVGVAVAVKNSAQIGTPNIPPVMILDGSQTQSCQNPQPLDSHMANLSAQFGAQSTLFAVRHHGGPNGAQAGKTGAGTMQWDGIGLARFRCDGATVLLVLITETEEVTVAWPGTNFNEMGVLGPVSASTTCPFSRDADAFVELVEILRMSASTAFVLMNIDCDGSGAVNVNCDF